MEEIRGDAENFPVGMRVLAVDDDPTCLKLLDTLLRKCQYNGFASFFFFFFLLKRLNFVLV